MSNLIVFNAISEGKILVWVKAKTAKELEEASISLLGSRQERNNPLAIEPAAIGLEGWVDQANVDDWQNLKAERCYLGRTEFEISEEMWGNDCSLMLITPVKKYTPLPIRIPLKIICDF